MNWTSPEVTIKKRKPWTRTYNIISLDIRTKRFTNNYPNPRKQPRIELTDEDRQRVIAEFAEVMKREPTDEEKETLFIEERKLKQTHLNIGSNQG